MKRFSLLLVMVWQSAALTAVWAQSIIPPPESVERVIVTAPAWLGDKPQTVIHNFVTSYAAAAHLSDELPRWKAPICPRTYGLSRDSYDDFVTARIREIADQIGAPVAPPIGCKPNVEIVFTAKPQDFLDKVRAMGPALLGSKPSHAETVGTMRYAIQAWYATATRDINGQLALDDEDFAGDFDASAKGGGLGIVNMPTHQIYGERFQTGLTSELAHIYVVADTARTKDYLLSAVADYVAVLALSQTQNFDACKPIPSITNLISPNCSDDLKPQGITDTDLAYLKAVYSVDPGTNYRAQQAYIADHIAAALGLH